FFFQPADGIRDFHVTGVQTCALPILFTDKIVWITGASSGIGEQLAYAFSKAGAFVILSARSKSELERVQRGCTFPEKTHIALLEIGRASCRTRVKSFEGGRSS